MTCWVMHKGYEYVKCLCAFQKISLLEMIAYTYVQNRA